MDDLGYDHPDPERSPNNYRPIKCLSMMWKVLTAQIMEESLDSLINLGLFPEDQKGRRKGIRKTLPKNAQNIQRTH